MDSEIQCPIALKWIIKHQKLLQKLDGCLESDKFEAKQISGVQYGLVIYPNGRVESERGSVWIGLDVNIGSEKRIEANYTITIDSNDFNKNFVHAFDQPQAQWSKKEYKICTHVELFDPKQKYIAFDELTIKVEGIFTVKRQIPVKILAIKNLSSYLWERDDKDFIIVTDETELKENIEIFLIGSVNVANVCELTNFSLKANAPALEKTCFEFLTKCLKNATPIYKFDDLDHEFLIKLLKNGFYAISET
uniref:Uncharacterized protein n=1 Tax=Panagrolaimus sp. ES5 TaxID=591445 RepID=A0AC34F560_9BILA